MVNGHFHMSVSRRKMCFISSPVKSSGIIRDQDCFERYFPSSVDRTPLKKNDDVVKTVALVNHFLARVGINDDFQIQNIFSLLTLSILCAKQKNCDYSYSSSAGNQPNLIKYAEKISG